MRRRTPPHPLNGALFGLRPTRLREPKRCAVCGTGLAKGSEALYDVLAKTVSCTVCPTQTTPPTTP